jgi:hypothetical protein
VQSHHAEFEARGARVVAVAQGSGDEADAFCRDLCTDYPCLGDPHKDVYGLFSLPRASWWNVTVAPFLEEPGLAFSRIQNASLKGSLMRHSDVLQLGGVVIADRAGTVRYLHRAKKTDDLPPATAILAELDRIAG